MCSMSTSKLLLIPHNEAQTFHLFKYYQVFVITTYLIVWKYLCYHTFQLPSVVFSIFIFIHFYPWGVLVQKEISYYLTINKNCVLALFLSFPEWFSPPELLIPITVSPPGLTSEAMWKFLHEWPDNSIDKRQGRMIFLSLYRWRRQLSMAWESKKSGCEDGPERTIHQHVRAMAT